MKGLLLVIAFIGSLALYGNTSLAQTAEYGWESYFEGDLGAPGISLASVEKMSVADSITLFVMDKQNVYVTEDEGTHWKAFQLPPSVQGNIRYDLKAVSKEALFVWGTKDLVSYHLFFSSNLGKTWEEKDQLHSVTLKTEGVRQDWYFFNPQHWIRVWEDTLVRYLHVAITKDGGVTYSEPGNDLYTICTSNPTLTPKQMLWMDTTHAFLELYGGVQPIQSYYTNDGGKTWQESKVGVQRTLFDVGAEISFLPLNPLFLCGIKMDTLFYSLNGGQIWIQRPLAISAQKATIAPDSSIWVEKFNPNSGYVYSTNKGITWISQDQSAFFNVTILPQFPDRRHGYLLFNDGSQRVARYKQLNVNSVGELGPAIKEKSKGYPNPATHSVTFDFAKNATLVQCSDVMGRSYSISTKRSSAGIECDIHSLPKGNYYFQFRTDQGKEILPIVKY